MDDDIKKREGKREGKRCYKGKLNIHYWYSMEIDNKWRKKEMKLSTLAHCSITVFLGALYPLALYFMGHYNS